MLYRGQKQRHFLACERVYLPQCASARDQDTVDARCGVAAQPSVFHRMIQHLVERCQNLPHTGGGLWFGVSVAACVRCQRS